MLKHLHLILRTSIFLLALLSLNFSAHAEMGMPVQFKLRNPSGTISLAWQTYNPAAGDTGNRMMLIHRVR